MNPNTDEAVFVIYEREKIRDPRLSQEREGENRDPRLSFKLQCR